MKVYGVLNLERHTYQAEIELVAPRYFPTYIVHVRYYKRDNR